MRREKGDRAGVNRASATRVAVGRAALARTVFGRIAFGRIALGDVPFERPVPSRAARARTARGRVAIAVPPLLLVILLTTLLGGCTTIGDIVTFDEVKPWERDVLAREDMQPVADAMREAADEHLYYSKEGSSGGGTLRGGGCGCN